MTVYWFLLLFPAIMALAYPREQSRYYLSASQTGALYVFAAIYALIGGLRFQVGGDWRKYLDIYNNIAASTPSEAMTFVDPLYALLNWGSAQVGGGIFLVNGICCWILGFGTISIARRMREPWMAVVIAVPYLLIVVGLGYVRQGAAIGMVMLAMANLERSRPVRTIAYLALAAGFHTTAVFVHPLFAYAIARGNRTLGIVMAALGIVIYQQYLSGRMETLDANYFGQQYDSQGSMVRVLMGALPSLLLLLAHRRFVAEPLVRGAWLAFAVANLIALAALAVSSSSTAVDRIALYFSIVQLVVFGQLRDLVPISPQNVVIVRFGMLALAVLVQLIWLVFAVHAEDWVPYKSIFQTVTL